MSKDVMTVDEVADYLSLSPATIYKKVEHRDIPFTKVGSLLRFPKWLIDRWLSETSVRPDRTLFDEFILLKQRYHLTQFLRAKGLEQSLLSDEQLRVELQAAIAELRAEQEREKDA